MNLWSSLATAALLWLPLLLFEAMKPNAAWQVFASPVLLHAFGLSGAVYLLCVSLVAAISSGTARIARTVSLAGPATISLASALVLVGLPQHHTWTADGWQPGASLALLLAAACLAAAVPIVLLARLLPQRIAEAILGVATVAAMAAFFYQAAELRLPMRRFGMSSPQLADPRFAVLGLGALATGSFIAHCQLIRGKIRSAALALTIGSVLLALAIPWRQGPEESHPSQATASDAPSQAVLVMIDTFRADHTSLGRYEVDTTPFMASLVGKGATYFEHATTPGSSTWPSTAAMLTSLWPFELGHDLPVQAPSISAIARDAGFATAGFNANSIIDRPRVRRAFERFETYGGYQSYRRSFFRFDLWSGRSQNHALRTMADYRLHKVDGNTLVTIAAEWLERHKDHPFFLYLHFVEPHWPYYEDESGQLPRAETPTAPISYIDLLPIPRKNRHLLKLSPSSPERVHLRHRYDSGILQADRLVARIFSTLEEIGLGESALVIIVGDHGEEFLEHGRFGHGHDVYNELTHVPMLVRWPMTPAFTAMPERVSTPVSLVDVLPTIADVMDWTIPESVAGTSLRGLATGDSVTRPVISTSLGKGGWRIAMRDGSLKARLVYNKNRDRTRPYELQAFDIDADPLERHPLADDDARAVELLAQSRELVDPRWRELNKKSPKRPKPAKQPPADAPKKINDAAIERLRALGYVD